MKCESDCNFFEVNFFYCYSGLCIFWYAFYYKYAEKDVFFSIRTTFVQIYCENCSSTIAFSKKNHQIILIDVKVIISVCLLFRSMIHKLTCAPNNQFNILKINQYFPEKHYLPREYIFSVNKTRFSKIRAHLKRTYGFTFLSRSNHILNKWLGVEHRLW